MYEQAHKGICDVWGLLEDNPHNGQQVGWNASQPDSRLIKIIAYIIFTE